MTKADLINEVAARTGFSRTVVHDILEVFFQVIKESILNRLSVEIRGFGSFFRKRKASKKARNLRTGTAIEVPERDVMAFKVSKTFAESLKTQ